MLRIQINLSPNEAVGLNKLAHLHLRTPREQLRFLLREELQRHGLLDSTHETDKEEGEYRDNDTDPPENE
jgi:hypothetical protein